MNGQPGHQFELRTLRGLVVLVRDHESTPALQAGGDAIAQRVGVGVDGFLLRLGWSLLLALAMRAEDWPQWGGPNRDTVWNETGIMESFPTGGLKISWRAPVGPGFSSPGVAQGRVYVTDSQVSQPKARERVLCFDAKTGKSLWTHSYEVDYADWTFDPKNPFGPRPTLLILVLDGGPPGPCVAALDRNSGGEVWRDLDVVATLSSPIVVTGAAGAGKRQLIVLTQGAVIALDPATAQSSFRVLAEPASPTPSRRTRTWLRRTGLTSAPPWPTSPASSNSSRTTRRSSRCAFTACYRRSKMPKP